MFTLALIILAILALSIFDLKKLYSEWKSVILSVPVISMVVFAALFALLVYTPTYITNRAVSTVVGDPNKTGHNGLTLTDFKNNLGEPRVAFALVGILLFFLFVGLRLHAYYRTRKSQKTTFDFIPFLPAIFLLSWMLIIFIISVFPTLIRINIPSGRVANYGTYPFAIVAAYALIEFIDFLRQDSKTLALKKSFLFASSLFIFAYIFSAGYYDNGQNIAPPTTAQKVQETLHASQYLAKNITGADDLLSDHINLTSDSWVKIFFMKDYNFPFYRANLDRYENGIDRQENCTLDMITSPSTTESQACFSDLGLDFVIVNKKTDAPQFSKDNSFSLVYSNDDVNVYYKPLTSATK